MNLPLPRRVFLMTLAASGAAIATGVQAQTLVDEKDAQAVALGYVTDASRANAKKYPKFAAGQHCGSCSRERPATRTVPARCTAASS
jgi:anaerobic selenocysteine-containing dehydrogenase